MRLKDKIAIITGGGRGIGKAIAAEFSKEGARVIVTAALKKDEIDSVASLTGGKAILSNISDKKDVAKLINNVTSEYGKIDILVNNAARGMKFVNESFMNLPKLFWEADPDMWRMVIDTNVNGVFLITQAVIPYMLKQRSGRIINISINYETMKRKGFSPYGPSKAALESMSIIWAQELVGTDITLNVLLPGGATNTGMIPDSFTEEQKKILIDPAVMGPPAVFLASDAAYRINGQRVIAKEWKDNLRSKGIELPFED